MNSPAATPQPTVQQSSKPRRGLFWTLVVLLLLAIVLPVYAVTSVLRMSADTLRVRDAVIPIASVTGQCDRRIELNIGGGLLGLARFATQFADIPAEARAALKSVRHVQVGVYYLPDAGSSSLREEASIMNRATAVLDARDWQRIVGVVDGRDVVGVFLPRNVSDVGELDVCVVVLSDHDLVVVSARANVEALIPLIQKAISEV